MPLAAANACSAPDDAFTMPDMLGLIVTQFPFVTAALSLNTAVARDHFARLCSAWRLAKPEDLLAKAKRYSGRKQPC